jgi:putative restriction endonuclease
MPHGAKGEADVWNEFSRNPEALAFESERLLSERSGRKLEAIAEVNESELPDEGIEREYVLRARVNQHFFRAAILAAYNSCCCVTGLAIPQLLVASHIVPWAMEPAQRMNPCNGLCLNALHDRAFDRGLMVIAGDLRVRFADSVRTSTKAHPQALNWLVSFHGQQVTLPKKFLPDLGLLRKHQTLCEQRESFSQA